MKTKIEAAYSSLSKSNKKIADYFLNHEKEVITMSIHELAQAIPTSSASISRFVKKVFGLNFAQTKIQMAKMIEQNEIVQIGDILEWADNCSNMPLKIIYNIDLLCREIISDNESETFALAAKTIADAPNIYLFGIGDSGIVALDFVHKLVKLGKNAVYNMDAHYNTIYSLVCKEKDVVIAISYSGETQEVLLASQQAKERGATIICMTNHQKSELYELSDIRFLLPYKEDDLFHAGAMFTRYCEFFITDMLFIDIAKELNEDAKELFASYQAMYDTLSDEKKESEALS